MKRKPTMSLALLLVIILVGAAMAASVTTKVVMIPDGLGGYIPMQAYAPNGKKAQNLTAASTTINHSANTAWSLYTPNDCKYRNMSTATKMGLQRTWLGGDRTVQVVNPSTKYVNYSGCTNGELDAM